MGFTQWYIIAKMRQFLLYSNNNDFIHKKENVFHSFSTVERLFLYLLNYQEGMKNTVKIFSTYISRFILIRSHNFLYPRRKYFEHILEKNIFTLYNFFGGS